MGLSLEQAVFACVFRYSLLQCVHGQHISFTSHLISAVASGYMVKNVVTKVGPRVIFLYFTDAMAHVDHVMETYNDALQGRSVAHQIVQLGTTE